MWGDASPEATAARLAGHGIGEIVVKDGANGALLRIEGTLTHIAVPAAVTPVDTTAAGDSFNAGYLVGRRRGETAAAAARLGHRLAARVIGHRGAIIPKEAMADL